MGHHGVPIHLWYSPESCSYGLSFLVSQRSLVGALGRGAIQQAIRVATSCRIGSRVGDDEVARRRYRVPFELVAGEIGAFFKEARNGLLDEIFPAGGIVDARRHHATDPGGCLLGPFQAGSRRCARCQNLSLNRTLLSLATIAQLAQLAIGWQKQYDDGVKSDERVQLNVRVRPPARKALKALAALRGRGQADVLEEMIEEALQKELARAADDIKRQGRRVFP
jgi:hypothetical protein